MNWDKDIIKKYKSYSTKRTVKRIENMKNGYWGLGHNGYIM